MSSSVHVDNKEKDILILGESPIQGLDGTTLTAKKCIQSTLMKRKRNFASAFIITEQTVIYLLMVYKLLGLKQKILKLNSSIMFRKHFKRFFCKQKKLN